MMTPNRKSVTRLTERALRKCEKFYHDGVHAFCTPAEFLALCWYFGTKPRSMDYYEAKVRKGDMSPTNHYLHVKKWTDVFPKSKYFCDCYINHDDGYY
jgi:hypothetical protein